jgi:hypothetical protein
MNGLGAWPLCTEPMDWYNLKSPDSYPLHQAQERAKGAMQR